MDQAHRSVPEVDAASFREEKNREVVDKRIAMKQHQRICQAQNPIKVIGVGDARADLGANGSCSRRGSCCASRVANFAASRRVPSCCPATALLSTERLCWAYDNTKFVYV